ncbi:alpha/beta fold hydrolase [Aeromonas finlandensis]|uniref:alpha/beta fold hydrolase n=1 Tax=Aeromonas finlandensis TaxID=1543375 RepID=UPI00067DD3F5|nr:alpha/beta fold hydrolase [Aeromonas finlandensis]
MKIKLLTIILSASVLTACGGEDNKSGTTANSVPDKIISSVQPTPKTTHFPAKYNPAEVCNDLKHQWGPDLAEIANRVSCDYFPSQQSTSDTQQRQTPSQKKSFNIFYVHYKATAERRGTIFFNPGGPADATPRMRNALLMLDIIDPDILKHYDVVTFDPRGTGYSALAHELRTCLLTDKSTVKPAMKPAEVVALLDKEIAAMPDQPADNTANSNEKAINNFISKQCGSIFQKYGSMFGANTIVEDMDNLRQYLKLEKITPFMISYGTRVAALYAYRHPEHVADIIIDSPVSPVTTDYVSTLKMDGNNHRAIINWRFGHSALQQSGVINNSIMDTGLYTDNAGNKIDKSTWNNIIADSVEDPHPDQAIFWQQDDATQLLARLAHNADGGSSAAGLISRPLFMAITCADNSRPYSWQELDLAEPAWQGAGAAARDNFNVCADWPYPRSPIPSVQANEIKLAPDSVALILGGEFDSKTPFSGAEEMRNAFGASARLVKVEQTSQHGQIYYASCADQSLKILLLGNKATLPGQQHCPSKDDEDDEDDATQ